MSNYLDVVSDIIRRAHVDLQKAGKIDIQFFVEYLKACLSAKDGYIMGTCGQDPKVISSWYFDQYTGQQKNKALYWKENCERVHDCQGLVEGFISRVQGKSINVYARTNYASWCDPKEAISSSIPAQYKVPGAAVFIHSKSHGHITHVGYLVEPVSKNNPEGDWYVIEARGVSYGVVRTKLNSRGWTHIGLMTKYFNYDTKDVTHTIPAPVDELGYRNLKKGMTGEDVRELQSILVDLGYDVGKYGCDGKFGVSTESAVKAFQTANNLTVDGIVGGKTLDRIRVLLNSKTTNVPDSPRKYVIKMTSGKTTYVRSLTGKIKGAIKLGDTLPYTGQIVKLPAISDRDFYVIDYLDGDVAVVSSKYTTIQEIV